MSSCPEEAMKAVDTVLSAYAAKLVWERWKPFMSGREVCPHCYRFKARNADDCVAGDCSKWHAIRDKEADADCKHFRDKTGHWAVPGWQPIESAPKTGPVETVLLYVPELHGTGGPVLAHWAEGGGEDQPRFGPGWFFWTGHAFHELPPEHKPTHWMRLPHCPADWRAPR